MTLIPLSEWSTARPHEGSHVPNAAYRADALLFREWPSKV